MVLFLSPVVDSSETIEVTLSFTPDLKNGAEIFEVCASCHLPEGWGNVDGTYPQIAGQHQNVLMQQLLDIRSGKRENNLMYPFVQERTIGGYQALADVVAYVAALPESPRHGRGPWPPGSPEHLRGEKYYQRLCAGCHGDNAMGNDRLAYPKLQRQHYRYLTEQVRRIQSGHRDSVIMSPILESLSEQDVQEILSFISYLGETEASLSEAAQ